MSDKQVATRQRTGTVWIIVGALGLALALIEVITIPSVMTDEYGSAGVAGKVVAILLLVAFGVAFLLAGLKQRRRHLER